MSIVGNIIGQVSQVINSSTEKGQIRRISDEEKDSIRTFARDELSKYSSPESVTKVTKWFGQLSELFGTLAGLDAEVGQVKESKKQEVEQEKQEIERVQKAKQILADTGIGSIFQFGMKEEDEYFKQDFVLNIASTTANEIKLSFYINKDAKSASFEDQIADIEFSVYGCGPEEAYSKPVELSSIKDSKQAPELMKLAERFFKDISRTDYYQEEVLPLTLSPGPDTIIMPAKKGA